MTQHTEASRFVIVDVPPAELPAKVDEAMAIYVAAMGYLPATGKQRAAHALKHSEYAAFRFRAAMNSHGRLIGFGYGYTSLPGQWWHDLVRKAIGKPGAHWLDDAFELSELHVSPASQGMGAGERILQSLADDLRHQTMVLSTPEGDNRAWRLYRRLGFVDLVRDHLFPGDHRPFGVLGATLPLTRADDDPLALGLS